MGNPLRNKKLRPTSDAPELGDIIKGLESIDELIELLTDELESTRNDDINGIGNYQQHWNRILAYVNSLLNDADRWGTQVKDIKKANVRIRTTANLFSRRLSTTIDDPEAIRTKFAASIETLANSLDSTVYAINEAKKEEKFNYKKLLIELPEKIRESSEKIFAMIDELRLLELAPREVNEILEELQFAVQQKGKIEARRMEKAKATYSEDEVDNLYMKLLRKKIRQIFGMTFEQLYDLDYQYQDAYGMTTEQVQNAQSGQDNRTMRKIKKMKPKKIGLQIDVPESFYNRLVDSNRRVEEHNGDNQEEISEDMKKESSVFKIIELFGSERLKDEQGKTFYRIQTDVLRTEKQVQEIYVGRQLRKKEPYVYKITHQNIQREVRKVLMDMVYRDGLGEYSEEELAIRMKLGDSNGRAAAVLAQPERKKEEKTFRTIPAKLKSIFSGSRKKEKSNIPTARNIVTIKDMQNWMDAIALETEIRTRMPGKENSTRELLEQFQTEFEMQRKNGVPKEEAYRSASKKIFGKEIITKVTFGRECFEDELSPSQWLLEESYRRLLDELISELVKYYIKYAITYYKDLIKERSKPKKIPRKIMEQRLCSISALEELIELGDGSAEEFIETIMHRRETLRLRVEEMINGVERLEKAYLDLKRKEFADAHRKAYRKDQDAVEEKMKGEKVQVITPVLRMLMLPEREFNAKARKKVNDAAREEAKKLPKDARKIKPVGIFISEEEKSLAIQLEGTQELFPEHVIKTNKPGTYTLGEYRRCVAEKGAKVAGEVLGNAWRDSIKFAEASGEIEGKVTEISGKALKSLPGFLER